MEAAEARGGEVVSSVVDVGGRYFLRGLDVLEAIR